MKKLNIAMFCINLVTFNDVNYKASDKKPDIRSTSREFFDLLEQYGIDSGRQNTTADLARDAYDIMYPFEREQQTEQFTEQQKSTSININDQSHTKSENAIINQYLNATNDNLVNYAETIIENPGIKMKPFEIAPVTERAINDLKREVNIDTPGYRHFINQSAVTHINNRHGVNGTADHSMANINDVARIGFVLENYDKVERALDKDGNYATTFSVHNSDGTNASTIVYRKAIDGTYFVVEAVPDNTKKTLNIVSAYIDGANNSGIAHHANNAFAYTSENELSTDEPNVSQQPQSVNPPIESLASKTGDLKQ